MFESLTRSHLRERALSGVPAVDEDRAPLEGEIPLQVIMVRLLEAGSSAVL